MTRLRDGKLAMNSFSTFCCVLRLALYSFESVNASLLEAAEAKAENGNCINLCIVAAVDEGREAITRLQGGKPCSLSQGYRS